ncbi:MEMO1 family protein, partial [Phenoliferia sp. Uapishka_3]
HLIARHLNTSGNVLDSQGFTRWLLVHKLRTDTRQRAIGMAQRGGRRITPSPTSHRLQSDHSPVSAVCSNTKLMAADSGGTGRHAGYSYSGPAAAWAYRSVDVSAIDRVFILGPSHHAYLDGCALPTCAEYETPLGSLTLDRGTIKELADTGKFQEMDIDTDEAEHSIEMHLPKAIKIVPILVGSISHSSEQRFGTLLAPYLSSPSTLFIISSDFCHWGTRFSYTYYLPPHLTNSDAPPAGYSLTRSTPSLPRPIHESISDLDHQGMEAIKFESGDKEASQAKEEFGEYLKDTKNTICGRHPIGVLLAALACLEGKGEKNKLEWVRYERSGLVESVKDSSVSYASAFVAPK